MHTLRQLHAELAGKVLDNKTEAKRLETAVAQVEAVMKLLDPSFSLRAVAVRRRKPNPWFKRGTMFRAALDAMRGAEDAMTARTIAERMLAAKRVTDASPAALSDLSGAVQSSMRQHKGGLVVLEDRGPPARWRLAPNP